MENPEALGFHQETTKDQENSMKTAGSVLYKTLHYFSTKLCFIFYLCGSRNLISTKPYFQIEEITTNFSYKIQNRRCYLNVSRNIII